MEKGKNFGDKVEFKVYDVEKIEEDGEQEDGEEEQICPKEIL